MEPNEFDRALVASAMLLAAAQGWRGVTVAAAARAAGLELGRARARFPGRAVILARLGQMADQSALAAAASEGPVRERLFDMVMARLDVFQAHRDGVLAVLRALPSEPGLALLLGAATKRSMAWLLEAAGADASGLRGELRQQGMIAVWLYTLRAWEKDESADLGGTMAALDKALERAEQASAWLNGRAPAGEAEVGPVADPDVPVIDVPPFADDGPSEPPLSPPEIM
jgi:AcrR family transcriptional regulator